MSGLVSRFEDRLLNSFEDRLNYEVAVVFGRRVSGDTTGGVGGEFEGRIRFLSSLMSSAVLVSTECLC